VGSLGEGEDGRDPDLEFAGMIVAATGLYDKIVKNILSVKINHEKPKEKISGVPECWTNRLMSILVQSPK
jgi:hypothetical protein